MGHDEVVQGDVLTSAEPDGASGDGCVFGARLVLRV